MLGCLCAAELCCVFRLANATVVRHPCLHQQQRQAIPSHRALRAPLPIHIATTRHARKPRTHPLVLPHGGCPKSSGGLVHTRLLARCHNKPQQKARKLGRSVSRAQRPMRVSCCVCRCGLGWSRGYSSGAVTRAAHTHLSVASLPAQFRHAVQPLRPAASAVSRCSTACAWNGGQRVVCVWVAAWGCFPRSVAQLAGPTHCSPYMGECQVTVVFSKAWGALA
jgi:hypothetical protein